MVRSIRVLLLVLTLLLVAWAFFDFGRRAVTRFAERAERPVELTVLHWGSPEEDKIVDDLVKSFQKEHPKVRVTRINAGSDFRNKIKTMMAAGTPPDVFYLPPDQLPEFAQLGLLASLDDRFAKEPQAWRDDFYPLLLEAFHYDTATGSLGRGPLYALPKDFTTAVFYVNLDLFRAAGIDVAAIQKNGWTWGEFEAACRKIRELNGTPAFAGREIYGTLFQIWPDTLRNLLWTEGADFFATNADGTPDFRKTALDSPGATRAIDRVYRMRIREQTAFNATGANKDGPQEFLNGNIGCTGPIGRWNVPVFKTIERFKWDIVPVPRGTTQASQIFYNGWSIAAKTKWPDEAYALTRYLCGREGQIQQARAGLAIPALQSVANSQDFLAPPGLPAMNAQAFLDAIPHARLQQLPRQTEWSRILEKWVNRCIVEGQSTPSDVGGDVQKWWLHELDSPLRRQEWAAFPWRSVLLVTMAIAAMLVTLLWWKAKREPLGPLDRATERAGYLFIAPWLIGFLVLTLGPMVASLLLSLAQWTGLEPMGAARSVGLANYHQLLSGYDPDFAKSLKVTAMFVLIGVPISQIAALIIAMLMNNPLKGITVFRTLYFVPSVVSGVAMATLWTQLLNDKTGLINSALRPLLGHVGPTLVIAGGVLLLGAMLVALFARRGGGLSEGQRLVVYCLAGFALAFVVVGTIAWMRGYNTRPPNWFGMDISNPDAPINDAARWAVPGFVLMGLWGVGGGMIIYLAGLKGISASLYEAAVIDGAGPLRKFWNVTLPMLSPLVFYNLVMGIIGSFQVFTQAYVMPQAPDNATLFYVLNLYRQAFEFHNMGYASAMAWILFVIVLMLTLLVFRGSRGLVYYEGLKS